MTRGTTVVLESTVYPGATREEFAPAIERGSEMTCGEDFFVGYSPRAGQSRRRGTRPLERRQGRQRPGQRPSERTSRHCTTGSSTPAFTGALDGSGRVRESHRERPARPQHRAGQRTRHRVRGTRRRHARRPRRGGNQVELPPVRTRAGRGHCIPRRSALPRVPRPPGRSRARTNPDRSRGQRVDATPRRRPDGEGAE